MGIEINIFNPRKLQSKMILHHICLLLFGIFSSTSCQNEYPIPENDETLPIPSQEETMKQLLQATGRKSSLFKTFNDVLKENQKYKEENQRLHDIIDDIISNITTIFESLDALTNVVDHNADDISSISSNLALNTRHIQENSDQLSIVNANV